MIRKSFQKKWNVSEYIRQKRTLDHVVFSRLEFSTGIFTVFFSLSNYTTYIETLSEYLLDNFGEILFSAKKIDENILERYKHSFTNIIQEHDTRIELFENIVILCENIKKLICKELRIST